MKLYQSDPIFRCWRINAIYRCVLRYGKSKEWALREVRKTCQGRSHDYLVDNWFIDINIFRMKLISEKEARDVRASEEPIAA